VQVQQQGQVAAQVRAPQQPHLPHAQHSRRGSSSSTSHRQGQEQCSSSRLQGCHLERHRAVPK
jgi:hypothetical protein